MPQKKNPDSAELVRGKAGTVIGSLMALLSLCKALPLSYNRDLQEATPNMWRAVETTRSAVRITKGMIATMNVNAESMAEKSVLGFTTATELADTMVRAGGIPFRTAHQIVSVLARGDGNPTLADVDAVAKDVIGETLSSRGLTEKMVKEALDPVLNINRRSITGGPAPSEMEKAIKSHLEELKDTKTSISELNGGIDESLKILYGIVEDYTGKKA
jgi:argininosuccinate lyase